MDLKELTIGTLFKVKNDNKIYKLIGYNADRSQVFYISIDDTIIYGNLKECSVDFIIEIV
jgi:hypothetical protein